jgi:hypothetical protein
MTTQRRAAFRVPAVLTRTVAELRALAAAAADGARSGRRPWVALALAAGAVITDALLHLPAAASALRAASAVRADLPLSVELVRLPLSALVPTSDLPLWLAAGQLLLVVGLAEMVLPRRAILLVAALGHLLPTLAARVMITVGPDHLLGLPRELGSVLDTGPSALTTAVGAWLLMVSGARRVSLLLGASLLVASRVSPGLDGREHLLAFAVGICGALLTRARARRDSAAVPVPTLRLRRAVATFVAVTGVLVVLHAYHPVRYAPDADADTTPGIAAVQLVNSAQLPVQLDRLPAGSWVAASASCLRPDGHAAVLWLRPRYLCVTDGGAGATELVLHYRVAGIPQTQRLRLA